VRIDIASAEGRAGRAIAHDEAEIQILIVPAGAREAADGMFFRQLAAESIDERSERGGRRPTPRRRALPSSVGGVAKRGIVTGAPAMVSSPSARPGVGSTPDRRRGSRFE